MKVTGFTFIRNAVLFDYPVKEAILSILPICDEFVVAVGKSKDDTLQVIRNIDKKIRIIETEWDDSLRKGGEVLAVETNKAYAAVAEDSDWAFYIQGDEIIHEKYLDTIYNKMLKYKNDPQVDGLLFNYAHFYGSYEYVGTASRWYRHEIRVIRKNDSIYSYRDAQGFRKGKNQKLQVVPVDAWVYHYGWVREPEAMQRKQMTFGKIYSREDVIRNAKKSKAFDYHSELSSLKRFEDTHPEVMKERITQKNWKFDYDLSFSQTSLKDRVKALLKAIGVDTEYKNYKIINK